MHNWSHNILHYKRKTFFKKSSGIPSVCQTDWIQIRPDVLSDMIWVHSVCKGYEQRTLEGNELMLALFMLYLCKIWIYMNIF